MEHPDFGAFVSTAYDSRLHVGTTAWYYLAQLQINPFAPFGSLPPRVTVDRLLTPDDQPPLSGTLDDPTAMIQVTVDGTTYLATNNGDGRRDENDHLLSAEGRQWNTLHDQ